MAEPRRVLLLHNPKSRAGAEAAGAARATLETAGIGVDAFDPCERHELIARLPAALSGHGAVVACGGDGTMNAVANALARTGTEAVMGVIPAGTANDFARTLGLPIDAAGAAAAIAGGAVRDIDLGEVNGAYFLNVASVGLSVALTRALTPGLKRRWGRLAYALAAARVLARARPFRATIAGAGASARVRSYQIAVGNGRFYGGGMAVEATAAVDDGRLDLYSLEFGSLWRMALMLPDFRAGRHGSWREVRTRSGREFRIETRRPRAINADGDLLAETPATFRLHRNALRVFVPAMRAEGA